MSTEVRAPTGLAPQPSQRGEPRHGSMRSRKFSEPRIVFAVTVSVYLAAAWWFWHQHLIPGDASSRLANGYYILFSRDPHLGAVGFVWNPLPSFIVLPALPLKLLIPALTHDSLLAPLTSALFMAGAVAVGNDALRRLPVSRTARLALTIAFAAHPMTVIYAGNGMSEALFLFFLTLTVRGLLQWLGNARPGSLVSVGLSLGLAYCVRYEALAPAAAVPVLVAATTWWRGRDRQEWRYAAALTDAILVGLPAALAVAGWAVAGRLVVGEWLPTVSSVYGNSAQVSANANVIGSVAGTTLAERTAYVSQQMIGLEPPILILLVLAGTLALHRRDPRIFAPLAVFGSVLAFGDFAFLTANSFGWLRFQIVTVPLAMLLAGLVLAARGTRASRAEFAGQPRHDKLMPGRIMRRPTVATSVAVVTVVALAVPMAAITVATPSLAREESEWLTAAGAARTAGLARLNAQIAAELDAMQLPDGSVITDTAYAFSIVLASKKPRQFVITSDRDFTAALRDPRGHRIRYLLVSASGAADAVRLAYPDAGRPTPDDRSARTWVDQGGNVLWTLTPVAAVTGAAHAASSNGRSPPR